jgi:RNA polymerase sigma factor (sigma-70 family)
MDQFLLPYLQASEESERQRHLDELLLVHAAPAVRRTLRQRLGFHVDQFGANPFNQDAEDLFQEVLTKIIQTLTELRSSPRGIEIENFKQYVSRTTANICINYLRAKSPARRRLKDRVRLLLTYHRDFAFWEADGQFLCGFAEWQDRRSPPMSRGRDQSIAEQLGAALSHRYPTQVPARTPLLKIVAELFDLTEGPIEIDTVVDILATLLKIEDHALASIDDDLDAETEPTFVEPQPTDSPDVGAPALLRRLWLLVKRLPTEQRDAFCYRFHDEGGEDFFSLVIDGHIATLTEIAEVFDRSAQEVRRLRSLMPMDGATAAAELNVPRAQVNKWRFRALRRLGEELLPKGRQRQK